MRHEYQAIVDAGFLVQLDDPWLAMRYMQEPDSSIAEVLKWGQLRVEVLNYALRDIPPDRIRYHTCYGINIGPRMSDLELRHFLDLVLSVRAGAYLLETQDTNMNGSYGSMCGFPKIRSLSRASLRIPAYWLNILSLLRSALCASPRSSEGSVSLPAPTAGSHQILGAYPRFTLRLFGQSLRRCNRVLELQAVSSGGSDEHIYSQLNCAEQLRK